MNGPVAVGTLMEPRVLRWTETVSERYDFAALSAFVNKTIQEPYDWRGLDLSTRDAKVWGFRSNACMLVGENWIFGSPYPKKDSFTLITSFPQPNSKWLNVTLHCRRNTRHFFELDRIEFTEHEVHFER
jgi:hypothetical protein